MVETLDLTFDAEVLAPGDDVDYDNLADIGESDQYDPDSTPGNGPDPDGDGFVGPIDDNPNDQNVDLDGDDDDADNEPVTPKLLSIGSVVFSDDNNNGNSRSKRR